MVKPNKKDYDFNDTFESWRYIKELEKYIEYLENAVSEIESTLIKALNRLNKSE